MAPQDVSSASRVPQTSSTTSSADHGKSKRARTKHACDECRRSQKKCDGDKPCTRCHLNGTHCTYSPHKSRSQCACTGQGDDANREAPVPDVFIFPDTTLSSFHTWSTTSSPDQSPRTSGSGLDTPSPTHLTHEEGLQAAQIPSIRNAASPSQTQLHHSPSSLQRNNHLYFQRSHSVPNVSSATPASPSYRTSFSPSVVSSSLPQYPLEQVAAMHEQISSPQAQVSQQTSQQLNSSSSSTYNELLLPNLMQRDAVSVSIFGFSSPQYHQHVPDMVLGHRVSPFYSDTTFHSPVPQPFDSQPQHHLDQSIDGYYISPTPTSEIGLDFRPSPSPNLFASQLGICSEQSIATVSSRTRASLSGRDVERSVYARHDGRFEYAHTHVRASEMAPPAMETRNTASISLHPRSPPLQWGNELAASPATGSRSDSAYSSPTSYGTYWAQ